MARAQGSLRNKRGPSVQPGSGQEASYKPRVKTASAQRKSEGVVVPARAAQHNAEGGKDPRAGHAEGRGAREGMAGQRTRSNHPGGRKPRDKVRYLQRRLWAAAKRQPGRRFHALYDRIHRTDVLWEAAAVEEHGVERFLEALQAELQTRKYRPKAVLRRYIPKADGRQELLNVGLGSMATHTAG